MRLPDIFFHRREKTKVKYFFNLQSVADESTAGSPGTSISFKVYPKRRESSAPSRELLFQGLGELEEKWHAQPEWKMICAEVSITLTGIVLHS